MPGALSRTVAVETVLPFFAVTLLRLVSIDLLSYLLGRRCGEAVLAWLESTEATGARTRAGQGPRGPQ